MSKTTVRKALAPLGADELRHVLLDLYDKSKEAKELLDFYAEPDIDAKVETYERLVTKEASRTKRRRPSPRISVMRSLLRRFALYEPDDEAVARLRVHIITSVCEAASGELLRDMTLDQMERFTAETVEFLAARRMLDTWLPRLRRAVEHIAPLSPRIPNPLRLSLTRLLDNPVS